MSASMAEVLAEHTDWATTNADDTWKLLCYDCGADLGLYEAHDIRAQFAAHQAEVLAANGYGKLEDDTCCCGVCGL